MCAGVSRVPGVQPPQGPPAHPPGHSSARQVGTQGCPKSTRAVGRGLVVNAAGRGKPRTQLEGVWTQPSLTPPCPALHHPAAFAAEAKPFGGQSGNADIRSTSHPAQPFSSPRSLSILGYLVQLELLSHPPTASAAASYQLWVESRLEPSERFLLMLLEEAFGAGRPCAAAPGVEHPRAAVSLCSRSGTRPEPPCVPAVVMVNVQPLFS